MRPLSPLLPRLGFVLALALVGAFMTAPLSGQQQDHVVVLLNARNPTPSMTKNQVRSLFLGKTAFWHGVVPVKVFARPSASGAARAFFEPMLGMSPQAYAKHWDKMQLSGRGVRPTTLGSAAELASAIAKTPGGIGFALASEAWNVSGVKIVTVR